MAIWSGKGSAKKYRVKVKGIRLEDLRFLERETLISAIEIKWEGPIKSGFPSLYRKSQQLPIRVLQLGEGSSAIEFRDEFVHDCAFSIVSKDPIFFAPWIVSFHLLSGENEEERSSTPTRSKMQVIGKVGLNLGELASKMDDQIEQKLPIALHIDGVSMEASLRLTVSFIEMKSNSHSRGPSDESLGANLNDTSIFHRRTKSQEDNKPKRSKLRIFSKRSNCMSPDIDEPELGTSSSFESNLNKIAFWKWRRRKQHSYKHKTESPVSILNDWETKEILSRDGKTRLMSKVFFASYDQRGAKASGASACAAIVAVIAHWLQTNPDALPVGLNELDHLITDGSSEWRKLCQDESNKDCFPDQHFDLETILKAGLRPLAVNPGDSRFGFFHPEAFELLRDAVSFDEIWGDINKNIDDFDPRVYIVRWNDHFFVLKVSADANYIVDSLGERLQEGCTQAYILKFDESSVMYESREGEERVACEGKECCREYMKRFMAAIQVRELKEEEGKGRKVDVFELYQRLQIDFHLSSSNSSSTPNTFVSNSPNTSYALLGDEHCL